MSKADRWKKIHVSNQDEQQGNPNKPALVDSLARIPGVSDEGRVITEQATETITKEVVEQVADEKTEGIENTSTISTHESVVESVNTNSTHETEVVETNTNSTQVVEVENKNTNPTHDNNPPESDEQAAGAEENGAASHDFVERVASGLRDSISRKKETKEKTHPRTSFQIRRDLLNKLRNFDDVHGGRIQGEFINNLLEDYFDELEKDPKWKKILNKKR